MGHEASEALHSALTISWDQVQFDKLLFLSSYMVALKAGLKQLLTSLCCCGQNIAAATADWPLEQSNIRILLWLMLCYGLCFVMAKYAVVYYAPWKFRKSKWRLSMSSQFLINIQKWCERSSELINPSEFFFINNIFYNISSKSLRGSSRELTLFTLPNTRLDRTHKKSEKKTQTHTQQQREAIW